ncbi:MAG TPA: GNAT family N-acetyltransferase [Micromonosporaceae bacterium]|nr:GNAT family N-acetyltransferase [Micromonosporaceae bacterium]
MRLVLTQHGTSTLVRGLEPEDEPAVLALFDDCAEWFEFATGQPSGPGDVQSLYYALPPGCDPAQKLLLVAETDRRISAVVDVVLDYPTVGECFVGAFLVAPGQRGRGFGSALVKALITEAGRHGVAAVRTTVTDRWESRLRFLESCGFQTSCTAALPGGNRNLGARERPVRVARLDLAVDVPASAKSDLE